MAAITDAEILAAVRAQLPEVGTVYLFGSRAAGTEFSGSDIDIVVTLSSRADPVHLWEAGEAIAVRLGADVDLVDMLAAGTVLQYQIVTTGRRLFARDPLEADLYEIYILSAMTALNEARAPLIQDILATGSVYGR